MTGKKFTLILGLLFTVLMASAQTVKVKKESARIKGENVEGFAIDLDAKETEVSASFNKYLKSLGKVKQNDGTYTLSESTLGGNSYKTPVYAVVKDKGSSAQAWIGIKKEEWPEGEEHVKKELEKTLYDFGVKFYRDKIQVQIDESNRALQAVEKQQQKLTTENKTLNTKLEDNKREKIQLEKALENNALENTTLLKKLEKNKHDQDSVGLANQQIKKVIEAQKERQKKVN